MQNIKQFLKSTEKSRALRVVPSVNINRFLKRLGNYPKALAFYITFNSSKCDFKKIIYVSKFILFYLLFETLESQFYELGF